jgi:hypothetical protein
MQVGVTIVQSKLVDYFYKIFGVFSIIFFILLYFKINFF